MDKKTEKFLNGLVKICQNWASLSSSAINKGNETENEARINGAFHSMLVMLSGCSSVNDFESIDLVQDGETLGEDCHMQSAYFDIFKRLKDGVNNE